MAPFAEEDAVDDEDPLLFFLRSEEFEVAAAVDFARTCIAGRAL